MDRYNIGTTFCLFLDANKKWHHLWFLDINCNEKVFSLEKSSDFYHSIQEITVLKYFAIIPKKSMNMGQILTSDFCFL